MPRRNRRCWLPLRRARRLGDHLASRYRRPSGASPVARPRARALLLMALRPLSDRIARWAATSPAPAARARSSSTVTARSPAPASMSAPAILVVAAALFDARGGILIAQRPGDKHMAGRWEFPGGKVGIHESESDALA